MTLLDDFTLDDLPPEPEWARRGGQQTFRGKIATGLRGARRAIRGDSSFFAHAYRGLLIALTAAMLGISPLGWCLLAVSASLVLMSEMFYGAIDTLVSTLGSAEDPGLRASREIASAGVLIGATASGAITITVLLLRFGYLLGWWDVVLR